MAEIQMLYDTNGGCHFPCWWGFSPGTDTLDTLQQFVARLPNDAILDGPFTLLPPAADLSRYILYYPPLEPVVDYSQATTFYVSGPKIVSIEVDPDASRWHKLDPVHLAEAYGAPQLAYAGGEDLIMYYPDLYIMSEFTTYQIIAAPNAKFCLIPKRGPIGWSSGLRYFDNVLESRVKSGEIHQTEEVAGYTVQAFFQSLKYSEAGYCVDALP
ncbi:MAG: hypothetical protein WBZ24_08745 [Anaerolineales bacterium]|jgi:hypothetical protein